MTKHEQIRLFTEPSTHVRDDLPPAPVPYQKIVGVQVGRQESWMPAYTGTPEELSYSVPKILGHRLLWYYNRHFGKNALRNNVDLIRNCFLFGIWMTRGIAHGSRYVANDLMYREARFTPPVGAPSRAGELSVIRCTLDVPDEPVLHGLVSMGPGTDAYVQIMTRGGDLGVTSLDDALAYRRTPVYLNTIVEPYYPIAPGDWDVGHYSVPASLQPDYYDRATNSA